MKRNTKEELRKQFSYWKIQKHEKILIIIMFLAFAVDYALSYIAYLQRPTFFIENEQLREAVYFFVDGTLPLLTILMFVVAVFMIIYILASKREIEDKLKSFPDWIKMSSRILPLTYLFFFVYFGRRLTAGMSWHTEINTSYMMVYHGFEFLCYLVGISLGVVILLGMGKTVYEGIKDGKNESHKSNKGNV